VTKLWRRQWSITGVENVPVIAQDKCAEQRRQEMYKPTFSQFNADPSGNRTCEGEMAKVSKADKKGGRATLPTIRGEETSLGSQKKKEKIATRNLK